MSYFFQTDEFWFLGVQLFLCLISIWAFYFDKKPKIGKIIRGEESRRMFTDSHRLIFVGILATCFAISDYPKDGKLFYFISDLVLGTYLCFYSTWFTNKIVGFISDFKNRQYK